MLAKFALLPLLGPFVAAQYNYSQYVNPFIGGEGPIPGQANGGGDIFVGGALPFGMAKVGIDSWETNLSLATINGGWTPQGLVTGISMMHESGTGGPPKYGIVAQMPLTNINAPVNILDNTTYWQKRVVNDTASVGYYSTKLENDVTFQLSAGRHSGIIEYDFPAGEKYVLVDVSHFLPNPGGSNEDQFYWNGAIELQNGTKVYTGYGSYGGGFSFSAPATTYFCGEFQQAPVEAHTFRGRSTAPVTRQHTWANEPIPHPTFRNQSREESGPLSDRVGAVFVFDNSSAQTVRSRVGISFISVEKACAYKNQEIVSWNLNDTVTAAVKEWNGDIFSKIQVPVGPNENQTNLALLYSSMYFMHLMPTDRTGENPLWDNTLDYWDDYYTLWDIFRCTVSFYLLFQPTYFSSMVRALINIWKYEGYMPDGRSGDYSGLVQGGSNADNVLADAYVKGLQGINWTEGYQAMLKDAQVTPYNNFNLVDPTNNIQVGRGALYDWLPLGYVSVDRSSRCISRTIEYSANDFSLSQVARGIAPQDVQKYLNRSANWQNIWAHNLTHTGVVGDQTFTGFPAPRLSTGEFNLTDYNPALCGGCEWSSITYEGTPFEYSFTVPHDMQTLISFMGGNDEFERRLDYIFQPNTSEQSLGANGAGITTIMNIGNEPDFATPYEYHYLNKQAKSVNASRILGNQFFKDATYGVPGNSDAGALNSWFLWQLIGLYPVVTQDVYLIVSPWFRDINMTINGNDTLRVTAQNLDNADSYYVQNVSINGQAWNKNWFVHDDVMKNGGTIEFVLGSQPVQWETGDVPPSPGYGATPQAINGTTDDGLSIPAGSG